MGGTAWVTLATNDSYALGALVVANSLKRVNTVHDLAILITPGVTLAMKNELLKVFNFVKEVDVFDSRDETNLRLLSRPDLGITFTKIHAWRLTQYSKCVFLDADVLIVQNPDELFDREELSAAPDAGWPDCFNSGVFVFRPSEDTYNALVDFALVNGSFDGGDQGLLNLFFNDWATADISKHLPFIYNMCSTSTYSYLPALKQFGSRVKIIHFIGSSKPWLQHFDTSSGAVSTSSSHISKFLQLWWEIFSAYVHPTLSTEMSGLARALAEVTIGSQISAEQLAYEDHIHRQQWEEGHIDYLGRDSWDNIWKKISQTIDPSRPEPPADAAALEASTQTPTAVPIEIIPKAEVKSDVTQLSPTEVPSVPTTVESPKPLTIKTETTDSPIHSDLPAKVTKAPELTSTPATESQFSTTETVSAKQEVSPDVSKVAESSVLPSSLPAETKVAEPSVLPSILPIDTKETSSETAQVIQPSSIPSSVLPDTPNVTPSTPIITSPTPPQSPLSAVSAQLENLKVDTSIPETPPVPTKSSEPTVQPEAQVPPVQSESQVPPVQSESQVPSVKPESQVQAVQSESQVPPVQSESQVSPVKPESQAPPVQADPPVPPKRKGGKGSAPQPQQSEPKPEHSKGGKGGKGKK